MPNGNEMQVVEAVGQAPGQISPKVKLPAWALTAIGVVLLVIGYLVGDNTVTAIGWTSLASGPLAGVLGFLPKPGPVMIPTKIDVGPASDAVLTDQLAKRDVPRQKR